MCSRQTTGKVRSLLHLLVSKGQKVRSIFFFLKKKKSYPHSSVRISLRTTEYRRITNPLVKTLVGQIPIQSG